MNAVDPKPGERILGVGYGSSPLIIAFAKEFPEAHFVVADFNSSSVEAGKRRAGNLDLELTAAPRGDPLPFNTGKFDKVILALALHESSSLEKAALAREVLRTLRRSGTLYAAEYDKPTGGREAAVLHLTAQLFGAEVVRSHVDGSWTKVFHQAGLTGIRRLSSHSVRFGRIAIVRARKM